MNPLTNLLNLYPIRSIKGYLVVVILRGALDGLAAVPPIGDPGYASLRDEMAIGAAGREAVLPLDGFFGLNDAMPHFHQRYLDGDALVVHATATA